MKTYNVNRKMRKRTAEPATTMGGADLAFSRENILSVSLDSETLLSLAPGPALRAFAANPNRK